MGFVMAWMMYQIWLKSVQYFGRCPDKIYDFLKRGITLSKRDRPYNKLHVHNYLGTDDVTVYQLWLRSVQYFGRRCPNLDKIFF
jgi:hypothetical protein